jgi:deazaflavin-dependent oxidoreductase (nitroreductase family)
VSDADPGDAEAVLDLMTTGRRTGEPHEIEIWFTILEDHVYLISGGGDRSDWVRNLVADPVAAVRIAGVTHPATGRVPIHPGAERTTAVEHLHRKYGDQVSGSLDDWKRDAFIVGLDLGRTLT